MDIRNTTEEAIVALSRAADDARELVGKGVDYAKLKWTLLRLESNLEESYLTLGKYLSDHRDELVDEECLKRITFLYQRIDSQKEEIARLTAIKAGSRKLCPACGTPLRANDLYCPRCGKKTGSAAIEE